MIRTEMNRRSLVLLTLSLLLVFTPVSLRAVDQAIEEAQFVLGKDLYGMGRYSEAIREFGRLLFDFQTSTLADACRFYMGSSYYSIGDYGKAVEQLELVTERYRESVYRAPSLYLMGRAEYLQNRPQKAISLFTAYQKEYPRQDFVDDSLFWKGEAYLSLDERENARACFTDLLKRYPDGNKAEAAWFELMLMELEDKTARDCGEVFRERVPEELKKALERKEAEIERLRGEVENLKAFLGKGGDERDKEIQAKIQALTALENLLAVKEKALNEKERRLNKAQALKKDNGEE